MNPFAEHRLRRAISQLLQGKDEARYLHEATGRLFAICAEDDGRYFVSEFLPNDPEILDLIRAEPNATQQILDQRGVDRESLAFFAGGYGLGTIYHPGFDAAVDAIVDAIDSNVVLKHCLTPEERAEQLGPKGLAREAVAEAEASVAYWQDQARRPGSQARSSMAPRACSAPLETTPKSGFSASSTTQAWRRGMTAAHSSWMAAGPFGSSGPTMTRPPRELSLTVSGRESPPPIRSLGGCRQRLASAKKKSTSICAKRKTASSPPGNVLRAFRCQARILTRSRGRGWGSPLSPCLPGQGSMPRWAPCPRLASPVPQASCAAQAHACSPPHCWAEPS